MNRRGKVDRRDNDLIEPFWLTHHHREEYHRCVVLPTGRRSIRICARCLGLYPVLVILLGIQFALPQLHLPRLPADYWIVFGAMLPALVDWSAGRFGYRGNNALRLFTGALLGLSLGRSLMLYFHTPTIAIFWIQLAIIVSVVLVTLVVRRATYR